MKDSQTKRILDHLKQGKGMSAMLAVKMFGCYRLAARVAELRNSGYNIKTTMVTHGKKRFALYQLEE